MKVSVTNEDAVGGDYMFKINCRLMTFVNNLTLGACQVFCIPSRIPLYLSKEKHQNE